MFISMTEGRFCEVKNLVDSMKKFKIVLLSTEVGRSEVDKFKEKIRH